MTESRQTLRKLQHLSARLEALVLELNDIRQELVAEAIPLADSRPPSVRGPSFKDYPEIDPTHQ
jgi:hypothetical protein